MNTGAVSKLLGVSSSTVQRWVKHLGLRMQRNKFGHYVYSEEDVDRLMAFKEQVQKGVPIGTITEKKTLRKANVQLQMQKSNNEKMLEKLNALERKIDRKADSVASYQLLQHRNEIEDLKKQIEMLQLQIDELKASKKESFHHSTETLIKNDHPKLKKKKMISSIFGF